MIMAEDQEQGKLHHEVFSKTCNRTKITFRGKPLFMRNASHQYSYLEKSNDRELSPGCPKAFLQSQLSNKSTPEINEHTCTKFMRNYIDKLKKQRKREKKKIDCFNHSKQNDSKLGTIGCDLASLPSIPLGKPKTLILKQIHPLAFRSNSVQQTANTKSSQIDRFVQIIKEMKEQDRNRQHSRRQSLGLPILSGRKVKGRHQQNMQMVDPWQNAVDYQQSVFEQYK